MLRRFSNLIKRFPILIRLPYYAFRFIQARYTIGVVAVVMDANDKILLVEHVLHPDHPWGLPGGWIGYNEDPALAIVRELQEELKVRATVEQIILAEKTNSYHIDMAFACTIANEVGTLSKELLDYEWVDHTSLPPLHSFHIRAIRTALQNKDIRSLV